MQYEGFGVALDSEVKFKPNASVIFMDKFYLQDDYGKDVYRVYCEDGDLDPEDDASKEEFVDSYENETYCWYGLEGLLTDYINDHDCDHTVRFRNEDYCIVVMATIPEDEQDKASMLTQDQIIKILQKYLCVLLDENSPCNIQWLTIQD